MLVGPEDRKRKVHWEMSQGKSTTCWTSHYAMRIQQSRRYWPFSTEPSDLEQWQRWLPRTIRSLTTRQCAHCCGYIYDVMRKPLYERGIDSPPSQRGNQGWESYPTRPAYKRSSWDSNPACLTMKLFILITYYCLIRLETSFINLLILLVLGFIWWQLLVLILL